MAYLRAKGCQEFQGFLLARPMAAPDLERWLAERGASPVHAMTQRVVDEMKLAV
jgi:two-component system CheB/CheR fusion protein